MFSTMRQLALCSAVLLLLVASAFAGNDLKPEEVLQRHLDSIGTAEVRAAAKSRVVEGTTSYKVLVGGSGRIDGKAVMVSEGHKLQFMLKITAQKYHGERFTSDGGRTLVEATYDDHTRSELGDFLKSQDFALREGLLGGTLSTAWTLLDLDAHKGKLKYQGRKKMEGTDLEAVSYLPNKTSDMEIVLYFDPQTFRHVMTVYKVNQHAGLAPAETIEATAGGQQFSAPGSDDADTSSRTEAHYLIQEKFSDFKSADGLTLPSHYELRFAEELQGGFMKTVQWEVTTTRVLNNVTLDPKNFQVP
jgi:hypothetical protein